MKKLEKRLSIIVPILNVEKYLSKCLDSLIVQDIPSNDYEIIIINDGSTDSSLEIAKSYSKKNQNFLLINQKKTGVGAARNAGIREAKGKYLIFVDSDDSIQPNCLKRLLECIETKKLDLLRFNYESLNDKGIIIPKTKNSVSRTIYSEDVVNGETFLTDYLGWACYVWLFIYDTSFIKKNNLYFNETIYFEDIDWMVRVLTFAKRVQSVNNQVYLYFQRSGSITQSTQIEYKNKTITDKLYNIGILNQLSKTNNNKKVSSWCNGMISLIFMGVLAYVENELPERKKEIINLLYKQNYLPLKSYRFTFKQRRNLFIINLNPNLYCFLKNKKSK